MSNVLITGITGSGGSYLAEYLVNKQPQINVHGICRWHSTTAVNNLGLLDQKIVVHECDLLDISSIIRVLQTVQPIKIFHLAAYANVRKCFDTPLSVINNNIMGTANLLEAVRFICPQSIIQICSTSEVYGNPLFTPMTEDHPLKPINPYAVSKLTQETLGYAYFKSWKLNIIITRMFAYINPRRHDLFATAFARQIVNIEKGKQDVLYHGNLNSIRTLIDVRDAMESYWVACEKCIYGESYNIGGHTTISVREFLNKLKQYALVKINSQQDVKLLRPVDVTKQIPDTTKFDTISNWQPCYTLDDSIRFLLDHCRNNT